MRDEWGRLGGASLKDVLLFKKRKGECGEIKCDDDGWEFGKIYYRDI